jgi:pilus assembly protein Flp/PilA
MKKMIRAMLWWDEAKQVLRNEKGQGMVEYGLILALVAVVAIAGLLLLGPKLNTLFTDTAGKL